IWRMVLCGGGFGLFQSPNNHTNISAAPRNRSRGASGMLGTARLLGQTSGAALEALMFNLFTTSGTHASLIQAAAFATLAAAV
ncbi:MFS transporter, partial [Pseudomonas aeruginosa]